MKTNHLPCVLLVGLAMPIQAQLAQTPAASPTAPPSPPAAATTPYSVVERGPNHRVWAKVTWQTNALGRIRAQTNSFVELASGLHFRNTAGQWQETSEQIDLLPGGFGAAATNGPRQVYFPADLYSGVIEIIAPDGKHLRSRPCAICYSDGTNRVLIAALTNSVGAILPSGNCVSYTNTFAGLRADVVGTCRKSGFECDLLIRERPQPPAAYGLDPARARLQLVTEFLDTADPAVKPSRPNAVDGLTDATLDFGALKLGPGRAFSVGDQSQQSGGAGGGPLGSQGARFTRL